MVPGVSEVEEVNATSGCQVFELTLDIKGHTCPPSSVPGLNPSCELYCSIVLLKGQNARCEPLCVCVVRCALCACVFLSWAPLATHN